MGKASTPVEALQHADARANIPTGELADFVAAEEGAPQPVRYPRDPSLDPQLVWRGKDEQDSEDLVVPAVPIYIQEKVDPRIIVENLRRTATQSAEEPELSLFDDFDGEDVADFSDKIDFYKHDANWSNRMILGDSLVAMTSLAEKERLRGKVQMIYLDPPYGIKFGSNWQVSTRKREVRDRRTEDVTRQPEQIRAFRDTWQLGIHSYLSYLRDRLTVGRDLLAEGGSVFVQIGDENVHRVRALLDEVFGDGNFIAQIAFTKTGGMSSEYLGGVYDIALWYAKDKKLAKYRPLFSQRTPGEKGATGYTLVELPDGSWRSMTKQEKINPGLLPTGAMIFDGTPLVSGGESSGGRQQFTFKGRTYTTPANRHWSTTDEGLERLVVADRIISIGNRIEFK